MSGTTIGLKFEIDVAFIGSIGLLVVFELFRLLIFELGIVLFELRIVFGTSIILAVLLLVAFNYVLEVFELLWVVFLISLLTFCVRFP